MHRQRRSAAAPDGMRAAPPLCRWYRCRGSAASPGSPVPERGQRLRQRRRHFREAAGLGEGVRLGRDHQDRENVGRAGFDRSRRDGGGRRGIWRSATGALAAGAASRRSTSAGAVAASTSMAGAATGGISTQRPPAAARLPLDSFRRRVNGRVAAPRASTPRPKPLAGPACWPPASTAQPQASLRRVRAGQAFWLPGQSRRQASGSPSPAWTCSWTTGRRARHSRAQASVGQAPRRRTHPASASRLRARPGRNRLSRSPSGERLAEQGRLSPKAMVRRLNESG